MKTKLVWAILICFLFSVNLSAQKNLEWIKKELDKDENVKKSEIIKSSFFELATYSIDNEEQVNKILRAFELDSKYASRAITREKSETNMSVIFDDKKNTSQVITQEKDKDNANTLLSQTLTFNIDDEEISYSFDKKENKKASFQYRMISKDKVWEKMDEHFPFIKDWSDYEEQVKVGVFRNLDSLKMKYPDFDSLVVRLPFFKTFNEKFNKSDKKPKYRIPENGYVVINGERLTAEEARKLGYDVETIPASEMNPVQEKPKFYIPKDSYIIINGKKVTAEEARKLGYDVETF